MRRYWAVLWLLGAGAAVASLAHAATTPTTLPITLNRDVGVAPELARPPVQPMGNPLWGISLNALTATRERPIFSPSRRPPTPTPPALVVVAPALPAPVSGPEQIPLTLVGTIVGGANSIAICFNPSTRDVVRLRIGENFQGWVLRAVHGREAAFEKATLQANLALPSPEDQQISAVPMPLLPSPISPGSAPAPASGTWRDGDGQLIAPPPKGR
jgi:hypothetical protein